MTKFLKQAGSGDFYLHTPALAARLDMFPVEESEVPAQFGGSLKAEKPAKRGKKNEGDGAPDAGEVDGEKAPEGGEKAPE